MPDSPLETAQRYAWASLARAAGWQPGDPIACPTCDGQTRNTAPHGCDDDCPPRCRGWKPMPCDACAALCPVCAEPVGAQRNKAGRCAACWVSASACPGFDGALCRCGNNGGADCDYCREIEYFTNEDLAETGLTLEQFRRDCHGTPALELEDGRA